MWSIKIVASIMTFCVQTLEVRVPSCKIIIIHKYTPGIELHVADVLDAVAGELQLGDEGVEVMRNVVNVVVRTRHDVILTVTEIVT